MLRHTLIDDVYCLIKSPACVGVLEAQLVQSRDFTSEHASFSLSLSSHSLTEITQPTQQEQAEQAHYRTSAILSPSLAPFSRSPLTDSIAL